MAIKAAPGGGSTKSGRRNVDKLGDTELVAINEAEAIPLPTVQGLITEGVRPTRAMTTGRAGSSVSELHGHSYENTGRAPSPETSKEMREQMRPGRQAGATIARAAAAASRASLLSRFDLSYKSLSLKDLELSHPIWYAPGVLRGVVERAAVPGMRQHFFRCQKHSSKPK